MKNGKPSWEETAVEPPNEKPSWEQMMGRIEPRQAIRAECVCGNTFEQDPHTHRRSFCSATCAERAAGTVKLAERARDFLAGYVMAQHEPDGTAGKVLKELLAALKGVRQGPNR